MMFLTTRMATEALLMERNLIKPRFNVLPRNGKSIPNVLIGRARRFP